MALDEQALRRPEFTEGVKIRLCDGQEWTFPQPMFVNFYFTRGRDGQSRLARGTAFGSDYDTLIDRYIDAEDAVSEAVGLFDLAFDLLARNYTVNANDAGRHLFCRALADSPQIEETNAMWAALSEHVMGAGPKASPVGSEPV